MGYYVTLDYSSVVIPAEKVEAAYEAVMSLQDRDDVRMNTFTEPETGVVHKWFKWLPEDLRTIPTLQQLLEELGFEFDDLEDGLHINRYDGKAGDEDIIFEQALAPFIVGETFSDGSQVAPLMAWTGEDSTRWQWRFVDGKMLGEDASIVYGWTFQERDEQRQWLLQQTPCAQRDGLLRVISAVE